MATSTKQSNLLVNAMGLAITLGIVFVTAFTISRAWQKGQKDKTLAKA